MSKFMRVPMYVKDTTPEIEWYIQKLKDNSNPNIFGEMQCMLGCGYEIWKYLSTKDYNLISIQPVEMITLDLGLDKVVFDDIKNLKLIVEYRLSNV